jgi:hypothetical protein
MFNIQSIWKKSRGSQVHCLAIVSILFLFSDHIYIYIVSEWLLLKVKWASFQLSWREQIGFQWDDVLFVLDQHALLEFYSAISLREKKQSCCSTRTHYPDSGVRRRRDHMVVGFTTTCAISAYHHYEVVSSNPAHDEVYSI